MSRPASAQPKNALSFGKPAPLSLPAQVEDVAALAQLEVLWHYDCVVIPRSHAVSGAKLQKTPASPLSPAAKSQPNSGSSACCSPPAPVSAASHASFSSSSQPLYQSNQNHRKQAALQRVFHTFDENGDGKVSIHEISRIFQKLGLEYSTESLLASLVTKSECHVDEQEFLALYESICCSDASASSSILQADVDQDLLAAFHVFDKDGNGFISPAELQGVLCSLGFPRGCQLEACVDMIARVDQNGDGLVDFFEFKKLFHAEDPFILIPSY